MNKAIAAGVIVAAAFALLGDGFLGYRWLLASTSPLFLGTGELVRAREQDGNVQC